MAHCHYIVITPSVFRYLQLTMSFLMIKHFHGHVFNWHVAISSTADCPFEKPHHVVANNLNIPCALEFIFRLLEGCELRYSLF